MAVWSEVGIDKLSPTSRLDPEYYQPIYLDNIDFLQNRCPHPTTILDTLLTSISGGATPSGAEYPDEGVPFLRVQNIMPGYLSLHDVVFIPESIHNGQLQRSRLLPGDVLLTITGVSYGKAAYVPSTLGEANINQHSVRMSLTSDVLPEYLATFLNCRFGKLQTDMKITGITRPALDYGEIRTIIVPILPNSEQKEIAAILRRAERTRQRSIEIYLEAEKLLLHELGLATLDRSHELTYQREFSEVAAAGRCDAEYYQPKYYRLFNALQKNGLVLKPLGSIIEPIRNGFDERNFVSEGTPYIRVGDVRNGRIDTDNAVRVNIDSKDIKKDVQLRSGDVLFTRKGSYGNAAVVREGQQGSIISSEIMLLRPTSRECTPHYLALYLNSLAGFQQVERFVHGVAYYSIAQPDLARVAIAVLPQKTQDRFAELTQKSLDSHEQAKLGFQEAIRRVQQMISGKDSSNVS